MNEQMSKQPFVISTREEWERLQKDIENLRATVAGIARMSANEGRRMKMWAEDAVKGFDTKIGDTLLAQANEILKWKKNSALWEENYQHILKSNHSMITTDEKKAMQDAISQRNEHIVKQQQQIAALYKHIDERESLYSNQAQTIKMHHEQKRNQEAAFNKWQHAVAEATKEYNATRNGNQ